MAAQQTLSSRSWYFYQPYQKWTGGCTVPLGLGPSAGVMVGNLLHFLGMAGKHCHRWNVVKDERVPLGYIFSSRF